MPFKYSCFFRIRMESNQLYGFGLNAIVGTAARRYHEEEALMYRLLAG